jgi:hypothetical protein
MKLFVRMLLVLGLAASAAQCQDREAPLAVDPSTNQLEPASISQMVALLEALLQTADEEPTKRRFKSIVQMWNTGDVAGARRGVFRIIDLLLQRLEDEDLDNPNGASPPTTEQALGELIARLLAFVDLSGGPIPPGAFEDEGAFAFCGPGGCVIVTGDGFAGVSVPPGALDHGLFIAISKLPNSPGPLPTDLDQYPFFYEFKILPEEELSETFEVVGPAAGFNDDVSVALCVLDNPPHPLGAPPSVVPDLALAHTDESGEGIEILPPGPSGFIDCTGANTALRSGPWSLFVASLFRPVTPRLLYAAPGDIGGQASSFSPFGAVDTTSGGPISTTTTLDAEPDTVFQGESVTLTATVNPAPPTSESPQVEFFEGASFLGSDLTNVDGVATLILDTSLGCEFGCLGVGSHVLTGEFLGTTSHDASTSNSVTVLVLPGG